MSFLYATGVSTGYTALSDYWALRFSSITGTSGESMSTIGTTGTNGFMEAFADGVMGALGYQFQDDAVAVAAVTTASTSFAAVGDGVANGFTTATFVAPAQKFYLVEIDVSCFMTVAADAVKFRLVNGSTPVFDSPAARLYFGTMSLHLRLSFRCPVLMSKGSNSLSLQWAVRDGVGTAKVDTNDFRCFTVSG